METIKWIFDGVGTEIISLIIGLLTGAGVGYRIGIKSSVKQKQIAGNNSSQIQIGNEHGNK